MDLANEYEKCVLHRILEDKAAAAPDAPFIHFDGAVQTLGELNGRANRIAAALQELGLRKGDRCAVMMENSTDYIATWLGIFKAGGVEVPMNSAYRGSILVHVLNTAGAGIVVADAGFAEVLAEALPECPAVRLCVMRQVGKGGQPERLASVETRDFDRVVAGAPARPAVEVSFSDPACILFTSGTTGPSKGAIISHRQLVAFGVTYRTIVSATGDDVFYNYLPFFHVAAKFIFMASLLCDGRMVLRTRLSISDFWRDVREHGCTVTTAVGGVCNMLYAQPDRPDDADNPMRLIYAVPIPHEIKEQFEARFGLQMVEGYGATENNIISWTTVEEAAPRGSCGRPSPLYEIRVVDEHNRDLPAGEAGEIVVRGRTPYLLMDGYFGMPQETVTVFRQQWFHTGDRGRFDADGWLYFIDRMKDAIRRRGENVSSYEVEQTVLRHPAVAEAAAVAVPAEYQEDELKLVAVRREDSDLSEEELFTWCARMLPGFMVPRYIEFRQSLPRTPTQKIRKVELRAEGAGSHGWDCQSHGYVITARGVKGLA